MDQVKDFAYAVFVKHLFWTLSVVIVLMGVVSWWMAAGDMKDEFDQNLSTVKGEHDTVEKIISKPTNQVFNQGTHQGMEDLIAKRRRDVYIAWRQKYEKQRDEVLVWPQGLGDQFITEIEDVLGGRPIEEVKVEPGQPDPLVFSLREEYRNEIKSLLPQLAKMINAEWSPGATEKETVARGSEEEQPEHEYTVWWNPQNQSEIQRTHFDWPHAERQLPSTLEILYSMEDYWVLKALMQIVARTNIDEETGEPADLPHKATIRRIYSIEIGKAVQSNRGSVYKPVPLELAESGNEAGALPPSDESMFGPGGDPANGRYVSGAQGGYQPISGDKLRSAAESDNPDEAYLAVAKRMPVRMRVKLDQRDLNKFLVECGNADLMLEVKQVRINPNAADVFSGIGSKPAPKNKGRDVTEGRSYPWDVEVEVYGIIYIFNPPSLHRLGLKEEEVAQFAPADESADATPAAGEPAADEPAADEDEAAPAAPAEQPAEDVPMAAESAKTEEQAPAASG